MPQERIFPKVPEFNVGIDNVRINSGKKIPELSPGYYRNWDIQGPVILKPGTYYMDTLDVTALGQLILSADTTLFVKSDIQISGNGVINLTAAVPAPNLRIFFDGGPDTTAKITGSSTVAISYYGPGSPLELTGSTEFYGSFIGKTVDNKGGATVHFDEGSLQRNLVRRLYRIVTWSQNSI